MLTHDEMQETPGAITVTELTGAHQWPDPREKFHHVELEINTACDLDCFACDRFSDVVSAPSMTLQQVMRFVEESMELAWPWERVRLLGGEPTLHPLFLDMCKQVMRLRDTYLPRLFIQVLSNGRGKLDLYRDWLTMNRIDPHVETEKEPGKTPTYFINTRVTPEERYPGVNEFPPCGIFGLRGCGIGLTRHGYFLDGAGAAVARMLGMDVGKQRLADVTWQAMLEQAKLLCRYCGHWNPVDHRTSKRVEETGEVTGPFWKAAIEKYREKRPEMTVYAA